MKPTIPPRIFRPAKACLLLGAALAAAGAARCAAPEDAVVAADGSGQYRTIQAAIDAAPQTASASHPWAIRVEPGVYREVVYIQREKRFVRLIGSDPLRTTLVYGLYASIRGPDGKPIGTFRTPTLWLDADDFTVEGMTLSNDAGPRGQALALRVDGDRDVFRDCRFLGWQDTLLGNRGRHYFQDCEIAGAVDFIFGAATEYYQNCAILCLGNGYVTAASTPPTQPFGFVFHQCRIAGAGPAVLTYLGRPWRPYASVTFLDTAMTAVIRPSGWNNWSKPEREKTSRFAEYDSTGPGANPAARAGWSRQLTPGEAQAITVQSVLGGADNWDPLKR